LVAQNKRKSHRPTNLGLPYALLTCPRHTNHFLFQPREFVWFPFAPSAAARKTRTRRDLCLPWNPSPEILSTFSLVSSASAVCLSVCPRSRGSPPEDRPSSGCGRAGRLSRMGVPSDEVVQIRHAAAAGDPAVVTVSCPDKTGLGCDLCRVVLLFGLSVVKGDMSTDGRWCYIVLWVLPRRGRPGPVPWGLLKDRLLQLCPVAAPFGFDTADLAAAGLQDAPPPAPRLFLLKLYCFDRMGLLHGNNTTCYRRFTKMIACIVQ
jgi:hypothetical protein